MDHFKVFYFSENGPRLLKEKNWHLHQDNKTQFSSSSEIENVTTFYSWYEQKQAIVLRLGLKFSPEVLLVDLRDNLHYSPLELVRAEPSDQTWDHFILTFGKLGDYFLPPNPIAILEDIKYKESTFKILQIPVRTKSFTRNIKALPIFWISFTDVLKAVSNDFKVKTLPQCQKDTVPAINILPRVLCESWEYCNNFIYILEKIRFPGSHSRHIFLRS